MLRAHAMRRQFAFEIALAAVGIGFTVAHLVDLEGTASEDRIVPPAGIGDHGHHRARQRRAQHRALANKDVARHLDGIGGMIAFRRILGIEAEEIDRLLAFQIYQSQHIAARDPGAPGRACRHNGILDDAALGKWQFISGHGETSLAATDGGCPVFHTVRNRASPVPTAFAHT